MLSRARVSGTLSPLAQVVDGHLILGNKTLFEHNSAPEGGNSIYLVAGSTLKYTLPAPPGRWLNIRQGITFSMDAGAFDVAEDLDFPYPCSPGVVGGRTADEQSGPGCSKPW